MTPNVLFEYATDDNKGTVYLTVRAQVDPGTEPVTDRLPELCNPGEPRVVLAVEVRDENGSKLSAAQLDERFGAGTYEDIVREVKASRLETFDHH